MKINLSKRIVRARKNNFRLGRKIRNQEARARSCTHPPYLIVHALLLRVPSRAIWIEFSRAEVLVEHIKVGIIFKNRWINGWKHV